MSFLHIYFNSSKSQPHEGPTLGITFKTARLAYWRGWTNIYTGMAS